MFSTTIEDEMGAEHVAAVFARGEISEQDAKSIVNESTGLTPKQTAALDRRLGARVAGLTPRKAGNLARQYAIGIDAAAAYERAKANRQDRFVSMFPDRDGAVLQFRGQAEQLLTNYKSLEAVAATAKAAGDSRTRGQDGGTSLDEVLGGVDERPHRRPSGRRTDHPRQRPGLCVRSHALKHLPGWRITADKCGDIAWQALTGHRYTSKRPPVFEYGSDPGRLRQ